MQGDACAFCEIVSGRREADVVFEDADAMGFLDHKPLFPGHVLLVPRAHCDTLADVPASLLAPLFGGVQLVARAVERATEAEGIFLAINNRVSQSVPHLHVHVVPRRRDDGLRGFFWPRRAYSGPEHVASVCEAIRRAVAQLLAEGNA